MSVNKAIILGRLGRDPELKHTPSGAAVCNFSVATTKTWNKDGQVQKKTEWHRIIAWQKTAEICAQYLRKGSEVFVEGEIETREWTDKDGGKRTTTEIIARDVRFIGGKPATPNEVQEHYEEQTFGDAPNWFAD